MGDKSKIEWTDATWPVVQGCDPVSQGCVNCYAVPLLWRMSHNPDAKISAPLKGLTEKHVNAAGEEILRFTGKLALREDRLTWPLQWKKPRMIFVPSHGDIFHKDVPDEFLTRIFVTMAIARQHTFQVLTKRSERMQTFVSSFDLAAAARYWAPSILKNETPWPLPNVWLGVSAEDQPNADERIPHLLATPAAIRFVSAEPLLGPIDLMMLRSGDKAFDALQGCHAFKDGDSYEHAGTCAKLDWVIVGGESGRGAREHDLHWSREILVQCRANGVAVFEKQLGARPFEREPSAWPNGYPNGDRSLTLMPDGFGRYFVNGLKNKKGGDWSEWPEDLRFREFPEVGAP